MDVDQLEQLGWLYSSQNQREGDFEDQWENASGSVLSLFLWKLWYLFIGDVKMWYYVNWLNLEIKWKGIGLKGNGDCEN